MRIHRSPWYKGIFAIVFAVVVTSVYYYLTEYPATVFGKTALSANTISDFGTPNLAKRIEGRALHPESSAEKNPGKEAQTEVLFITSLVEDNIKKAEGVITIPGDKEMKTRSVELLKYALPVYKHEYLDYAKLCDSKAPQSEKDALLKKIAVTYNAGFEERYNSLMVIAKAFAKSHNLKVNWD